MGINTYEMFPKPKSKGPSKRYTPKSGNASGNEDFSPDGWGAGAKDFYKKSKKKK
jgi:hypothetical protein